MTPAQEEWARCKHWIAAALERVPFYNIEYIEREVEEHRMVFWPGLHGAAITEFIEYPNGRALNVFAGGGDSGTALREFVETIEPALVTWAKVSSCKWIIGSGRHGWEPTCKQMGYRPVCIAMVKEVS